MKQNKEIIIGLTGGSGCGKTTVANILKKFNSYIIDADIIAHKVIQKEQKAYYEIIENFGKNILTEKKDIDRRVLGKIVFEDNKKLKLLNDITHKYILQEIKDEIEFAKNKKCFKYIIIDAPLLIESNLHKIVDKVWLMYSEKEDRINRLLKRDNISKETIIKRIESQTPFENLKQFADFIIYNKNDINLEKVILDELNKEFK